MCKAIRIGYIPEHFVRLNTRVRRHVYIYSENSLVTLVSVFFSQKGFQ